MPTARQKLALLWTPPLSGARVSFGISAATTEPSLGWLRRMPITLSPSMLTMWSCWQALAYKLGQREILRLRDEAKQALGPKFDIKKFHDVVLRNGAVSLASLRHEVDAYIARGGTL